MFHCLYHLDPRLGVDYVSLNIGLQIQKLRMRHLKKQVHKRYNL